MVYFNFTLALRLNIQHKCPSHQAFVVARAHCAAISIAAGWGGEWRVPVGCAVEEGRRPAHRVAALLKGRREVNLPAASASALAANPLAPPRDCFQQTRQLKLVEETAKE